LYTCYSATGKACCSYLIDAEIGSFYSEIIPSVCSGEAAGSELANWNCLGCDGSISNKYVTKAEAT